ncbi:MAG: pilus assembly protein [bacterium]|nr:pilus assembly protein [bacterium]
MKILGKLPIARRFFREDGENGVVLVITALAMVILMGMAAFAVDLGWLYYSQLNVRKAAEASALAGVVHMPLPSCSDPVSGTEPYDTALELAVTHGYNHGANATVSPSMGANCNQLTVNIASSVDTFFMRVFGRNSFSIDETATAEQLPPLHIGSDEPYLGEDPTDPTRDRDFFLAISGQDRGKGQGDAYASLWYDGSNGSDYTANAERRSPSYWYAVEVLPGSSSEGGSLQIQVYDGVTHDGDGNGNGHPQDGPAYDWQFGEDAGSPDAREDGSETVTLFRVYAPDATPAEWVDNSVLLCSGDYHGRGDSLYESAAENAWDTICTIPNAAAGIYVVEVSTSGNTNVINGFSMRTLVDGVSHNDSQVYGLGAMSLWQFDTGSNPVFKIARLDEVYAGSELIINLWDISDIGTSASIQFNNPIPGAPINTLDCTVQTRGESGAGGSGYGADSSGANCQLSFNSGDYNNEWIDFKFDVPGDYTCSGEECWIFVSYSVGGSITDRTTWTASVNGLPIHLVP